MSRSVWKLPYFHNSFLKISFLKRQQKRAVNRIFLTAARSSQISTRLRKVRVGIHNGKLFRLFRVRSEMILFKFGEFSATRRVASGLEMHIDKSSQT